MSRKKIVAGNWKMNKDYLAGMELISEAVYMIKDELHKEVTTVFATPYIHLSSVSKLIQSETNFHVAAQNCHQEKSGAYTGEISAEMIASLGVQYVILGHSERREYQKEDSALLAKKVNIALENKLTPIFCIGEKLEERESNVHFKTVQNQIEESLFHLSADQMKLIVLAYEPVWAIGTGKTASPEQAQEMHAFIRGIVAAQYSTEIAESISILYGGSCNPGNAKVLFSQKDIDGGLIGGASLKSRDFTDIHIAYNTL
jgi:triosephosphate isomerase